MSWQPSDETFQAGQWQGTDQTFNEVTPFGPPGSLYQIVDALPTPTQALVGTLFYLNQQPGALYLLRENSIGSLVYVKYGGRAVSLVFCSGDFTPLGTGLDSVTKEVYWDPDEFPQLVNITWTCAYLFLRTDTACSSGQTGLQIARSTGSGAFTNVGYLNGTPVTLGAGVYEGSTTTFSQATVNSGDKLKMNFTQLGVGAGGFSAYLLLRES